MSKWVSSLGALLWKRGVRPIRMVELGAEKEEVLPPSSPAREQGGQWASPGGWCRDVSSVCGWLQLAVSDTSGWGSGECPKGLAGGIQHVGNLTMPSCRQQGWIRGSTPHGDVTQVLWGCSWGGVPRMGLLASPCS